MAKDIAGKANDVIVLPVRQISLRRTVIKFFRRRENFIEGKGARPLSVAKARVFGVDGLNEQIKKRNRNNAEVAQ